MKHEYHEGPDARKKFDEGMTKLFKTPKTTVIPLKDVPKRKAKRKKASKG